MEFFITTATFQRSLKPRLQRLAAEGEVSWYVVNSSNEFESSEPASAVHAVTWGSFKGKEIATATMVEEMAFRTWGEEAFSIWGEWGRCVGEVARSMTAGDPEKDRLRRCREFLLGMRNRTVLVNVIGHGYKEGDRFWEMIVQD